MKGTRVKQLFERYLFRYMPTFWVRQNTVFQIPVCYLYRGFCFESSAYSADDCYPTVFVVPLFLPKEGLTFTYGDRLGRSVTITPETEQDVMADLRNRMLGPGMKFLSRLDTLEKFAANAGRVADRREPGVKEAIAYAHILKGDYEKGCKMALSLANEIRRDVRGRKESPWMDDIMLRAQRIGDAASQSPEAALGILNEWTEEMRAFHKLPS